MVGLAVVCDAWLVSDPSFPTAALSIAAAQRVYAERRIRLSDAAVPNHPMALVELPDQQLGFCTV